MASPLCNWFPIECMCVYIYIHVEDFLYFQLSHHEPDPDGGEDFGGQDQRMALEAQLGPWLCSMMYLCSVL